VTRIQAAAVVAGERALAEQVVDEQVWDRVGTASREPHGRGAPPANLRAATELLAAGSDDERGCADAARRRRDPVEEPTHPTFWNGTRTTWIAPLLYVYFNSSMGGHLITVTYRRDRNAARSSSVKSCGCSQAAKWPPLSTSL
jgi:hypothetical protein